MGVFFRFIAVVFLALGLMAFGGDALASLEKGSVVMRSLTEDLMLIDADPREWLERTLPSPVASVLETLMSFPAFAVLGVFGLILGALAWGRPEDEYDTDNMGDVVD